MARWRIVGEVNTFAESWRDGISYTFWVREDRIKLLYSDGTIGILSGSGFVFDRDHYDFRTGVVTSIKHYKMSDVAWGHTGTMIDRIDGLSGKMRVIDFFAGWGVEEWWLGYDDDVRNLVKNSVNPTDHELVSSWGNDTVYLGAGNDTIEGFDGNDRLFGQGGNDVLDGGLSELPETNTGDDFLSGGAGNDILYGRDGTDTLIGGIGADRLYGGDGNDLLAGGAGDDSFYAGAGDDRIIGGDNSDGVFYLEHFDNLTIVAQGIGSVITSASSGTDLITGVEVLLTLDGAYFWSDASHHWTKVAGPDAVQNHFSEMFPDILFTVTDEVLLMS